MTSDLHIRYAGAAWHYFVQSSKIKVTGHSSRQQHEKCSSSGYGCTLQSDTHIV